MRAFIQRHPVTSYFCLTYLISWGGAFLAVAPKLLHGQPIARMDSLLMFPLLLLGPSIAGIVLTGVVDGRSGLRDLFARLTHGRVGVRWYGVALLLAPVLMLALLASLSTLLSPVFSPHFLLWGIIFGVVAGFLEEIGWTGYAFPRMRAQHSPLSASLLLGLLWGVWHLPVIDFLGSAGPHGAYWLPFVLAFIAVLMGLRVLIAWMYSNTGSVLLAQLMHMSLTGSLVMLSPHVSAGQEVLWYALYAVVLWTAVALVAAHYGKRLVEPPARVEAI